MELMSDEKQAGEQAVPAGETQQVAERSWLSDVGWFAAGAVTNGVVSDVYGGGKAAAKDAWGRVTGKGEHPEPPDDGGFLDE